MFLSLICLDTSKWFFLFSLIFKKINELGFFVKINNFLFFLEFLLWFSHCFHFPFSSVTLSAYTQKLLFWDSWRSRCATKTINSTLALHIWKIKCNIPFFEIINWRLLNLIRIKCLYMLIPFICCQIIGLWRPWFWSW